MAYPKWFDIHEVSKLHTLANEYTNIRNFLLLNVKKDWVDVWMEDFSLKKLMASDFLNIKTVCTFTFLKCIQTFFDHLSRLYFLSRFIILIIRSNIISLLFWSACQVSDIVLKDIYLSSKKRLSFFVFQFMIIHLFLIVSCGFNNFLQLIFVFVKSCNLNSVKAKMLKNSFFAEL